MIGLVMRAVVGEAMGPFSMIIGPLIAVCAICGIMHFCRCRLRDCGCCKRFLRATGTDSFDDFEMMILVHKASFTASTKTSVSIRIRAGEHEVATDSSKEGVFQQALSLFVEQGTEVLKFELLNTSDQVLAELQMNIMKDVLQDDKLCAPRPVKEKMFVMKQKNKNVLNPRLVLTFAAELPGDEEQALLAGLNASSETEWMLQQQLQKVQKQDERGVAGTSTGERKPTEQISEIELLARGCVGPLHKFGTLGAKSVTYVGVLGPPRRKKFALHMWDSESDYRSDKPAREEIELLRISAVAPDPGRADVFTLSYFDKEKKSQKMVFQRIDRGRDVWVELLQILVTKVHEDHAAKKNMKKK